MKRRVVKQGGSIMIAIPSGETPFKVGDELTVRYDKGNLIYSLEETRLPVAVEKKVFHPRMDVEPSSQPQPTVEREEVTSPSILSQPEIKPDPIAKAIDSITDRLFGISKAKTKELVEDSI